MAIQVFSKGWIVQPLYIVMHFVVLSHLSDIPLCGLLCMFVPGRAIIRLYFEIYALAMIDWVIGIQFTGHLIRGVDCFYQLSMLTWVSSMCWCMSIPVTKYWFMYSSTLLLLGISPMYLIQDISGLLCMFVCRVESPSGSVLRWMG